MLKGGSDARCRGGQGEQSNVRQRGVKICGLQLQGRVMEMLCAFGVKHLKNVKVSLFSQPDLDDV